MLEGDAVLVLEGQTDQLSLPLDQKCPIPISFKSEAPASANRIALRIGVGSGRSIAGALRSSQNWKAKVEAMQIFVAGARAFLAGDSFHGECISIWPGAPTDLVAKLVAKGIVEKI